MASATGHTVLGQCHRSHRAGAGTDLAWAAQTLPTRPQHVLQVWVSCTALGELLSACGWPLQEGFSSLSAFSVLVSHR